MARAHTVKRKQRGSSRELTIALGMVAVFVVLIGFGVFMVTRGAASAAADPDVVAGEPITAVHDMGAGPRIPFLPKDGPQPNVIVDESFFNFGKIGAKDVVTHTFYVRNDGEAPLTISRAYTTCGCTTAEISSNVIPPGKAVTVELVFDAGYHDAAGQTVRRGVILENNDPDQPQAEIWVQAEVGTN